MMIMKELSLYMIRDMALKSGRMVYNSIQFANLINKDQPVASVYMNRMLKKGLATPLLKGRISFSDNDLVIASQLVEPSYISLHSALLFHNIIQQVPKNVQSVTSINSATYGHLGLEYHKIQPSLMFGFERHILQNSYCFVATPEKALLDGYYLNMFSKLDMRELGNTDSFRELAPMLRKFHGKGSIRLLESIL